MALFVVGLLPAILGLILIPVGIIMGKRAKKEQRRDGSRRYFRTVTWGGVALIIVAALLIVGSHITNIEPGYIGKAYHLSGKVSPLHEGYNWVNPWAKVHVLKTTNQTFVYSEGEADNDIYGAQTSEKDYIRAVSTLVARIDTDKIDEYISLFGFENLSDKSIQQMFKTKSRSSLEYVVGSKTTQEVMSNKNSISAESGQHFIDSISHLPIIVESFTIDDLVGEEKYENAIKEQAELRMKRVNAELQKAVNEEEAAANRVEAEGKAQVLKIQATAEADVKKIEAENTAAIKTIEAENAAKVAKIKADNEAEVKRIQAEADASVRVTKATAEADATVKQGEAEAKAIEATGEAYKANPELINLKMKEIDAEVQKSWSEKWSGFSFEGLNGISFTNFTDVLKGILPNFTN